MARLAVDATLGVVDVVEGLHHTIARRSAAVGPGPAGRTTGITGFVYRAVRGTTRLTGHGVDALMRHLTPPAGPSPPARDALLAALNGAWGDHLQAAGNPLALPMTLRHQGQDLPLQRAELARALPQATGRLLVLVHGLCMNDRQWLRDGHDHGAALARQLGATPVYVRHNSGLHVSTNGRALATLLDDVVAQWPVPVRELLIVGHSMGGLIARSACFQAQQQGRAWPQRLRGLACLGTPHHGAPLERGGLLLDRLLGVSPYSAPFVRLGTSRSAGITDLRFGNLQDADWQGRSAQAQRADDRTPAPLPAGVPVFLVAATTAAAGAGLRSKVLDRTLGDGLVPLHSALGRHHNPALALPVPARHVRVIRGANHWDLLSRPEVSDWLARQWQRTLGVPGAG